jgi:hypothetical protein
MDKPNIEEVVKEKYREAALRVNTGGSTCCGATSATNCGPDPITSNLYEAGQSGDLPAEALLASLGCGNPTALAKLAAGEVVLDLGSGGGIDVLLSAKRVGSTGQAYGLDMTDDVITRGEIAPEIRESALLWVGCIAGALDENDYRSKLTAAGFDQVDIEATRIYRVEDASLLQLKMSPGQICTSRRCRTRHFRLWVSGFSPHQGCENDDFSR